MKRSAQSITILIIASFMATGFIIPATRAALPDDHQIYRITTAPNLSVNNFSLTNNSLPVEYRPATITIFRFELNQISLPGPRYMAYGPSAITFSIEIVYLGVLIVIVAIAVGLWYVRGRKQDTPEENK